VIVVNFMRKNCPSIAGLVDSAFVINVHFGEVMEFSWFLPFGLLEINTLGLVIGPFFTSRLRVEPENKSGRGRSRYFFAPIILEYCCIDNFDYPKAITLTDLNLSKALNLKISLSSLNGLF